MRKWTKPLVEKKDTTLQLSYNLPHRVHISQPYPTPAPNGSQIILYGHDNGVRVVWRGGKREKPSPDVKNAAGRNTANDDVLMLVDTEPEGEPISDSDAEDDVSGTYPQIVQFLDLSLGTEVLHLAVPQVHQATTSLLSDALPPLLKDKIVFTTACADCTLRVITLPIAPPAPGSRKASSSAGSDSRWGEEVVVIGGVTGHQGIPCGLTMTWTSRTGTPSEEREDQRMDEDDESPERRRQRPSTAGQPPREPSEWEFVIASHSYELSGLLLIFRIPLNSSASLQPVSPEHLLPYQTHCLPSPAASISFNPSTYPSELHTQLLVSETQGAVRILDPFASRQAGPDAHFPERGAWLASFSTSFELINDADMLSPGIPRRKRILDAKWASHGRSVIVLLADGQWGVWDLAAQLGGAKIAGFSLSGYLSGSTPFNTIDTTIKKPRGSRSSLAPMTPNTRRVKEESLFGGSGSKSSSPVVRGGISVSSNRTTTGGRTDESVVLWYGTDVYSIARFQAFCRRSVGGGKADTGSLYSPGLSRLDGLSLYGEAINSITQLPSLSQDHNSAAGLLRDLLVAAERRLIFFSTSFPAAEESRSSVTARQDQAESSVSTDQHLLARGDLDLGGMNRLLDGMSGTAADTTNRNSIARRVGFAA